MMQLIKNVWKNLFTIFELDCEKSFTLLENRKLKPRQDLIDPINQIQNLKKQMLINCQFLMEIPIIQ